MVQVSARLSHAVMTVRNWTSERAAESHEAVAGIITGHATAALQLVGRACQRFGGGAAGAVVGGTQPPVMMDLQGVNGDVWEVLRGVSNHTLNTCWQAAVEMASKPLAVLRR
mmetsp:Transcript_5562/g.12324  ORF Transcript_5562/g.12324 Transcript_5562/m.12324 type:complete len:112 (+) Transcript_5562:1660-1995(+)